MMAKKVENAEKGKKGPELTPSLSCPIFRRSFLWHAVISQVRHELTVSVGSG